MQSDTSSPTNSSFENPHRLPVPWRCYQCGYRNKILDTEVKYEMDHRSLYCTSCAAPSLEMWRMFQHRNGITRHELRVLSTDGGRYSSSYDVDRIISEDGVCYCTAAACDVNVLFESKFKNRVSLLSPTSFAIRAPESGYTAPIASALLFVLDSEKQVPLTSSYDGFTRTQFEAYYQNRRAASFVLPALNECFADVAPIDIQRLIFSFLDFTGPIHPVGYANLSRESVFHIAQESPVRFLRKGRFLLLKLLHSRGYGGNIDIQFFEVFGFENELDMQPKFDELYGPLVKNDFKKLY